MRVMSAMLATQFESFAECCLELARALERWDRGDTFFAMNAVKRGMSIAEIAGFLGRTEDEVLEQIRSLIPRESSKRGHCG